MRRYTVLVLTIAAVAGLFSLPIEVAHRLFSSRGAAMAADGATAVSSL